MSLASLLYFVHGVSQTAAPATRTIGLFEVLFSLGLFAACLGLLRAQQRA